MPPPPPIRLEVFEAALELLVKNGIDPSHPAFATSSVQASAVTLLMDGGWSPAVAAAVVAGLSD
jgi:hypothetical protein